MMFANAYALALRALTAFAERARLRQGRVVTQPPMAELAASLDLNRLIAEGGLAEDGRLAQFLTEYLAVATNLRHPGFMAHQVAVPHPLSPIASLIDGFTNNAMAIYEMGPSAATVEQAVLNWMLAKVGWSPMPTPGAAPDAHANDAATPCGGGVLTHGGSLANLTALAAARAQIAPNAWRDGAPSGLAILAPANCHYSIARAAGLLGLGQNAVVAAPTDADGRIDPAALGPAIDALRQDGRLVMAVVANACSTAAGLYDRLRPIGELCRDKGVWLHVDGAHGAAALVSPSLKGLLDGVALADSLVWDAHKMLRTPTLCAAVLTRDQRALDGAFQEEASYLFHDKEEPGVDFVHRTVECTKAALGLKVFFALAAEGEAGLAAFVESRTRFALEIAEYLRAQPDVTVATTPESNIVCFRLTGDDDHQLALRRKLTAAGRSYISTTLFRQRRWLRLALMNPDTSLDDVQEMLAALRAM